MQRNATQCIPQDYLPRNEAVVLGIANYCILVAAGSPGNCLELSAMGAPWLQTKFPGIYMINSSIPPFHIRESVSHANSAAHLGIIIHHYCSKLFSTAPQLSCPALS